MQFRDIEVISSSLGQMLTGADWSEGHLGIELALERVKIGHPVFAGKDGIAALGFVNDRDNHCRVAELLRIEQVRIHGGHGKIKLALVQAFHAALIVSLVILIRQEPASPVQGGFHLW